MPTTAAPRTGTLAALPLGAGLVVAIVLGAIALQGPMEPTPSSTPASAFTTAFDLYAWTGVDPESGESIIGRGQKVSQRIALGRGSAWADGSNVAFTRDEGARVIAGAVVGDRITEFEVPFDMNTAKAPDINTANARVTPDGTTLFAHAGTQGVDRGIIRIDLSDGKVSSVVGESRLGDFGRNFLKLSPTGRTLMSTLCDLTRCFVDVVDTRSGAVRRLPEPFPASLITDRYVFGRLEPGQPWRAWDLAANKSLDVALDPDLVARSLVAVTDSLVVLDSGAARTYQVLALDLDTGAVDTLYERLGEDGDGGAQLMRMGAVAGRWVFLSDAASISDKLAADGTLPTLQPLGAELGEASVDAVVLSED